MTAVINDAFMVCTDCFGYITKGDFSALDSCYPPAFSARRARAIEMGVEGAEGYACAGDAERDVNFSSAPCECCGLTLSGSRHHCVLLAYGG